MGRALTRSRPVSPTLLGNTIATRAGAVAVSAGAVGLIAETARAGPQTPAGQLFLLTTAIAVVLALLLIVLPWKRIPSEAMVLCVMTAMVIGSLPVIADPRSNGWLPLLPVWMWAGLSVPRYTRWLVGLPALVLAVAVPILVTGQPLPALQIVAALVIVIGAGEGVALAAERAVQARTRAERAEARTAALLTHAPGVVMVLDADECVQEVSDGTSRSLGSVDLGSSLSALVHDGDLAPVQAGIAEAHTQPGRQVPLEVRMRRADGAWRLLSGSLTAMPADQELGLILSAVDVTADREARDSAVRLAAVDALTGLASRTAIRTAIDRAHEQLQSAGHGDCGVLAFVDLDGFKLVNDGLGHDVGDRLLVRVADRLRSLATDGVAVGRLSGDEFAVLDPGRSALEQVAFGQQVLTALIGIEWLDGHELKISASVGVAALHADGDTDELLRRADLAMYRAKAVGGAAAHVAEQRPHLVRSADDRRATS